MTPKERVLTAFKKLPGLPDQMPIQFDLCKQLTDAFGKKLGIEPDYAMSYYEDLTYRISANGIRTRMGSDCIVVGGTEASDFKAEVVSGDVTKNEFGMHMKPTSLYVEVVKCPLEKANSVSDIQNYSIPDPYAAGRFDKAKKDIDRFGKDYFIIGDVELSLFEMAWHLTGMEKYLVALMMGEPWIEKLNDLVEEWTTGLVVQLVDAGVEALWFGEDLGSQSSTLISPEQWREVFKPRHIRMIETAKARNPEVMIIMHSDGAVAPLIEDWIEMGIEVFNPVQPNLPGSDPQELMENYGGRINFFGGIDQQELLPRGDKESIREEIHRRAAIMGKGGGYLMAPAHILQTDVSMETVEFMIETIQNLIITNWISTQ
jgi:uroporphyrinogen decarboxylase